MSFRAIQLALLFCLVGMASGVSADDLERIKSNGEIVVATEAAFPPFEFIEDNKIVGFGSDLLAEVAKDLDVEVKQLNLPFESLLPGLDANDYDLVATSVVITPQRAETYAFTRPFATIENVVLTNASNQDIEEIGDLSGAIIATQKGSSTEALALEIAQELNEGGGGFEDLHLFPTYAGAISALQSEQADAVVIGGLTAREFMADMPGQFRIALTYGEPVYLSWVVRPGNSQLLESINNTITRLIETGELARMQQRWVGEVMPVPDSGYLPENAVQMD